MTVEGVWDLTIATPVGRIKPVVELIRNGGEFTGVAHGAGEEVPLQRDLARSPGRSRPGGSASQDCSDGQVTSDVFTARCIP